jgi:hypothetical protein
MPDRPVTLPAPELARRLAWFFWRSPADDSLVQQAGAITSTAGLRVLADAMLADPRSQGGADALARTWLGNQDIENGIERSGVAELAPPLRQSMALEQRLFLHEALADRSATLTTLLTAPYSFVDARLAPLYDVPAPTRGFVKTPLGGSRSGLLTQMGVLATWPRAPHRARWLNDRMLCTPLPVPPVLPDSSFVPPRPGESYRATFERQVRQQAVCAGCHEVMEVGFALEHFDTVGRYRANDGEGPVDSVALLRANINDPDVTVKDAPDLGKRLALRCDVQACVAQSFLAHGFGQSLPLQIDTSAATGKDQPRFDAQASELAAAFAHANFRLGDLMVAVTQTPLFLQP